MEIKAGNDRKSLWQAVQEQTGLPSYCSGSGQCGKCRVKVIRGEASVSSADRKHLTEREIEAGYRIACQSRPLTECLLETCGKEEQEMQILSVPLMDREPAKEQSCSIAVDIGTTTLAFALVDAAGTVIAAESGLNHQRSYGADVISRITAALKGQEQRLVETLRSDVRAGIEGLLERENRTLSDVSRVVVAGNTVMEQLFFGISVRELGFYPFAPHSHGFLMAEYGSLYPAIGEHKGLPVTGFPCIAGFVGGDITAGLYELLSEEEEHRGKHAREGVQIFLDIGTNGELACITPQEIIVASTAAGPVFEGGAISCGMGCMPGAIYATRIAEDMLECRTIGEASPEGICGSGLIEAVADMLSLHLIDRSGGLSSGYREKGYLLARTEEGRELRLTQADIREFQMAKAAVAAGLELLAGESGNEKEIRRFVLAGGLGNGLSVGKAVKTGILPENARGKAVSGGNMALKGAIRLLREGEAGHRRIEELLPAIRHFPLAEGKKFPECYLRHMEF